MLCAKQSHVKKIFLAFPKSLAQIEVKILLGRRFSALPKDCNAPKRRGLELAPKKNKYHLQIITKKKELLDQVFTSVAKALFLN